MRPAEMFSHWAEVRTGLRTTLERFPDDQLGYVPFPGSWPVGQIALHIADCEDNWIHGVVRGEIEPWVFYDAADHPTRADVLAMLDSSHEKTLAFLDGLTADDMHRQYSVPDGEPARLGWILCHVLEHEIHHRGELSLIHGLLGREGLDV